MLMWSKAPDLATMAIVRGAGNVFINPYTGRILGTRGNKYFTQQVHQLHIRLWAGGAPESSSSSSPRADCICGGRSSA
jgi:hypothetical protein